MGQQHLAGRLDDLKETHDQRFVTQDKRIDKLERYERETAMAASKYGAAAGAVVAVGIAVAKSFLK